MLIKFSAFAPPISAQVALNGFFLEQEDRDRLDALDKALTLVYLHGILTDAEVRRARQRLLHKLQECEIAVLEPVEPDQDPNHPD